MAKIIRRTWTTQGPTGKRVRHVAYGFTHMINATRERRFSSEWLTEADALAGLSARLKQVEAGRLTRPADRTLGELTEEYLRYKADQGKRTVKDDARIIRRCLLPAFGVGLPVRKLEESAIAQYEKRRAGTFLPPGPRQDGAIETWRAVLRREGWDV